jgi:ELWxxDGT repeat protein
MTHRLQRQILCLAAAFALAGPSLTHAQLIGNRMVSDLNPGSSGSDPTNLTAFTTNLCFSAFTPALGTELWRCDGSTITLVSNINNTVTDAGGGVFLGNSSSPRELTVFSNTLYFTAFDPSRGGELWRYNGTNTSRVADISPDADDSVKANPNSSWPTGFVTLGSELFFSANGGTSKLNYELWKYNGASVSQIANIHPDSGSDFSSYPTGMTPFKGALYFMADDGANGYELWRSFGTNATLFANINPGSASSYPEYFTAFNNRLYFSAFTTASGYELWQTDGTNVSQVANLNPSGNGSFPENLAVFNNALYFRANDGSNGYELWKYNGSILTLVSNINLAGDAFPKNLTAFQNALYFSANDGVHGWELWKYDGTNAVMVSDLNPTGDSFPEWLTVFNGALYFVATTPDTGYELWSCDGNAITLAADISPGPGSSYPLDLVVCNGALYFSAADDGLANWELWKLWPAPFRITAIQNLNTNISLMWATLGGRTNIVQAAGSVAGPFTNLSDPILTYGPGEIVTNYFDAGAAASNGVKFYRVIQP